MGNFIPTREFKRKYDRLFKEDPIMANIFLLMCEMADKNGKIKLKNGPDGIPGEEIYNLMRDRFKDPEVYAL